MSSSLARMLRHAGFQLAAMSGEKEEWWHFSRRRAIPRMLRRMSRLAAGLFALDLELETDGVQLRVGRASRRLFIPAPGDAPTVKEGLEPFLRELDAALADCGVEHGFRVFSEKEWFGCFVQLLPRDVEAPWFFDASSISLDVREERTSPSDRAPLRDRPAREAVRERLQVSRASVGHRGPHRRCRVLRAARRPYDRARGDLRRASVRRRCRRWRVREPYADRQ